MSNYSRLQRERLQLRDGKKDDEKPEQNLKNAPKVPAFAHISGIFVRFFNLVRIERIKHIKGLYGNYDGTKED